MKHPDKALSMIKFVLWLNKYGIDFSKPPTPKEWDSKFAIYVINYAKHLQQTLSLNMFIECDKDGKPLEKPKDENYSDIQIADGDFKEKIRDYQQAERSVIFEGYELTYGKSYITLRNPSLSSAYQIGYIKKEQPLTDLKTKLEKRSIELTIGRILDIPITENFYREIIK